MAYTERLARLLYALLRAFIVIVVLGWLLRAASLVFIIIGGSDGPQRHVADEIEAIQRAHPNMEHKMTAEQLEQLRRNYR